MAATVTAKGQITIPKAVREALGVKAGSKVEFKPLDDGHIAIVIGEALHDAVAPRQHPAAAQRGRAAIELRLQSGRYGAHDFSFLSPSPACGRGLG